MAMTIRLAQVLEALGGFRPLELDADLDERQRAFEQVARFCLKRKGVGTKCSNGGHDQSGNLQVIARRDFGLNDFQRKVCVERARDFLQEAREAEALRQAGMQLEAAA
jgi:hypothetical protein